MTNLNQNSISRSLRGMTLLGAVLAVCLVSACNVVDGNGNVVEETRQLPHAVDELRIDDITVQIEIDESYRDQPVVVLTGDENILPHIRTDLQGRRLVIEDDAWLNPTVPIRARVRVSAINRIEAHGGNLYFNLEGHRRLVVQAGGDAHVYLSGDTRTLELEASGNSQVDARDLAAWVGKVRLQEAARADVCVEDTLLTEQSGHSELHSFCRTYDVVEDLQEEAHVVHHW